jgi:hypothetical protein
MPESPPEPPIFAAASDNDAAAGQSAARKITLSGCRRSAKTAAMGRLGAEHDRRLTLMAAAHDPVGPGCAHDPAHAVRLHARLPIL